MSARERAVALFALACYAVLLALLLSRHEMWRDELQAWVLSRDSGSLAELWRNTRYEGHPLLWHVLLLPLAHAFDSPLAMQALHWLIAAGAAAVLLLRAPFSVGVRVALAMSYLPLYEYGAISRNYAASVLGVWLACAGLAAGRTPWLAVAGVALAANASPMGIVLAPALAAALALTPAWRSRRAAALALVTLAVVAAAAQCLPASDYEHAREWALRPDLERVAYVLRGFATALLPLPSGDARFWGNSVLFPGWPFPAGSTAAIAAKGAAVVAAAVFALAWAVRRSRRSLAAWGLGAAALLAFSYVKLPGAIRHHGFLWVLLVAVLWIALADGTLPRPRSLLILAPLLAAGLWAAGVAAYWDWRAPFSGARCAAERLEALGLTELPLVGGVDFATSGVAGYLPHGRLYYPASRREGSFVVWNLERTRQDRLAPEEIVREALALDRGQGVVVLLNSPLADGAGACRLVSHCAAAIVPDEELFIDVCAAAKSPE